MRCPPAFVTSVEVGFVSRDGFRWKSVRPIKPVAAEITKEDLFLPWIHFEPAGGHADRGTDRFEERHERQYNA